MSKYICGQVEGALVGDGILFGMEELSQWACFHAVLLSKRLGCSH